MSAIAEVVAFAAGTIIVLGTAGSLIRTLVVPRATTSRLTSLVSSKIVRNSCSISFRIKKTP